MVSSNEMKLIDFSNGIRSAEIQHNFNVIVNQLSRERLAIAGHGVSSGLELSINDFTITVSEGALVDIDGKEIFFDEENIKISLPKLTNSSEIKEVSATGRLFLDGIPYAANRKTTSQFVDVKDSGIKVIRYDNSSTTVPLVGIEGNNVIVDARLVGQKMIVEYSHTNKRYDTIYIDEDYNISVAEGMTSSSPSVVIPAKYKYILGFIYVDSFYLNNVNEIEAKLFIKNDLSQLRNIYTDKNNDLFICGIPFKDLQIVHMIEPKNPAENTLWYDSFSNKLKVWKTIDGIAEWIPVNDTSFIPVLEYKIWKPEENPLDKQTFLFNEEELNLRFTPGRNELQVLIGQIPLHSDQFDEIVAEDKDGEYENIGVGFKLAEPLDRQDFVEVRITHRVNDNPLKRRFQRSATFVAADAFNYDFNSGTKKFGTNAPYRKGENQLEVYVDGRRLVLGVDFIEATDLDVAAEIGSASREFEIVSSLMDGSVIAYKITTSVYSYDNVDKLLGDLNTRLYNVEVEVSEAVSEVNRISQETSSNLSQMNDKIIALENSNNEHDTFLKKTDMIGSSNIAPELGIGIAKGFINVQLSKVGTNVPVTGVDPEDFVIMFDMQRIGGNSIVIRGTDYEIRKTPDESSSFIEFLNPDAVQEGNTIYLTGIKFK